MKRLFYSVCTLTSLGIFQLCAQLAALNVDPVVSVILVGDSILLAVMTVICGLSAYRGEDIL